MISKLMNLQARIPSLLQGIFLAIPQYKMKSLLKKLNILLQKKKKKLFEIIEVEDNPERSIREKKKMQHIYLHEGLFYGIKQS